VLVEAHEDGVVAGLGPRLEVEHHPDYYSLAPGRPNGSRRGGGSPGGPGGGTGPISGREPAGAPEAARRDCGERARRGGVGNRGGFLSRVSCAWKRSRAGGAMGGCLYSLFLILFLFILIEAFDFLCRCLYYICIFSV
jgi:hypothetical protein